MSDNKFLQCKNCGASNDKSNTKCDYCGTIISNKKHEIKNKKELLRSYLIDIARVPLLSREKEISLARQVQEYMKVERAEQEIIQLTGDEPDLEVLSKKLDLSISQIKKILKSGQRAKESMVASNLRLVVAVAKKYTDRDDLLLDLIQQGTTGLVKSVEKFDPEKGYKFSTYAYWWIRQAIAREISKMGYSPDKQKQQENLESHLICLPDLQQKVLRMKYGLDEYEPMTLAEIGKVLGISGDKVRDLERDGLKLLSSLQNYFGL